MKAYIAKIERCRKLIGLWKPIKESRQIKKGKHKGLYDVVLMDGRKALATAVTDSTFGYAEKGGKA